MQNGTGLNRHCGALCQSPLPAIAGICACWGGDDPKAADAGQGRRCRTDGRCSGRGKQPHFMTCAKARNPVKTGVLSHFCRTLLDKQETPVIACRWVKNRA